MKVTRLILLCVLFALASCKKTDETTEPTPQPVAVKQNDQAGSSAADSGIEDVNDYLSNKGGGAGQRSGTYDLPCGVVSVDSAVIAGKKVYTFKYGSKTPCGYKYKSGDISFQLINGTHFSDIDAVHAVTFINYVVKSNATGDEVKLNGTLYTTNVKGGYVWQAIVLGDTIVHKVRGKFTTTYANGQSREKNYFQRKTWTSSNGWEGITFQMSGDTVISSANVSETGKTYEGNYDYQTEILTDFKISNCSDSFTGPFVLKYGTARLNVSIPSISPSYIEVEAGYHYVLGESSGEKVNNCDSKAYKITTVFGTTTKTEYQLY